MKGMWATRALEVSAASASSAVSQPGPASSEISQVHRTRELRATEQPKARQVVLGQEAVRIPGGLEKGIATFPGLVDPILVTIEDVEIRIGVEPGSGMVQRRRCQPVTHAYPSEERAAGLFQTVDPPVPRHEADPLVLRRCGLEAAPPSGGAEWG